jgi:hypothetical protein
MTTNDDHQAHERSAPDKQKPSSPKIPDKTQGKKK